MTFRVGQKVVCVDKALGSILGIREPDKGDIATVSNIYDHPEGLVLELIEFPQRNHSGYAPGWLAISFRPIVERKTDISELQALLNPANHKEFA